MLGLTANIISDSIGSRLGDHSGLSRKRDLQVQRLCDSSRSIITAIHPNTKTLPSNRKLLWNKLTSYVHRELGTRVYRTAHHPPRHSSTLFGSGSYDQSLNLLPSRSHRGARASLLHLRLHLRRASHHARLVPHIRRPRRTKLKAPVVSSYQLLEMESTHILPRRVRTLLHWC